MSEPFDTLVLSGGSVNGIALLGALQYAADNYKLKELKTYIGTSAGAFCCYLLAIGYTPIEIICFICTSGIMDRMKHMNVVAMINGQGALSFATIQENLEKMTIEKIGKFITLKDLDQQLGKKLICVTYNVSKQKVEYVSSDNYPDLPCLTALRMSANLPLVFEPFKYMNNYYIDGGVANNFAIDIGSQLGTNVFGVFLAYTSCTDDVKENDQNILQYIYKLMFVPISQLTKQRIEAADKTKCKILQITSANYVKFFNFNVNAKLKLEMFSAGYADAKKFFETI